MREQLRNSTINLVERLMLQVRGRIPVAVGFGISASGHVRSLVAAGADGVIVGSAFVKIVEQNRRNPGKAAQRLKKASHSLKMATKCLR